MTAGILLCGLVAVASVFSFAVRTNNANRQVAVATTLLSDKMEEFRSAPFTDPVWMNAIGSETLVIAGERYVRMWQIKSGTPRTGTVISYTRRYARATRPSGLVRTTA